MPTYRLHYFPESGNSYKLALMLTLCGQTFEPVWTDCQIGKHVQSGLIRDGISSNAGFGLCRRDFDTRQHGPALVARCAADLGRRLRPGGG